MQVTFLGDPVVIKGTPPNVGDRAPDATLTSRSGEEVALSSLMGKRPVVLSVIPDVLTRTCERQTKRFAKELAELDVEFVTVSRNTVDEFNQWNADNDLDVYTLSDTSNEFGESYGLAVDLDGNERLARSVFLVDTDGVIRYKQVVQEIADEPDYKETLEEIEKL